MKHSLETKIKAIKYVLERHGGQRASARKFGVHHTCLHQWIAIYQIHGVDGLAIKQRTYPGEFKLSVVDCILKHHLSYRAGAARFNIPSVSTVKQWIKIYQEKGAQALFSDQRGGAKIMKTKIPAIDDSTYLDKLSPEEMATQLRYLQAENDYLKKFLALVQEKKILAQKIKQR